MKRIYISEVLSVDLKSRSTVAQLVDSIKPYETEELILDFKDVYFATRSFIDEFYNVIIKDKRYKVENMNNDIQNLLETVKSTQNSKKLVVSTQKVSRCSTVKEFCCCLTNLAF